MDFSGPDSNDFANVRALNRAYLMRLRAPQPGRSLREKMPDDAAGRIEALTDLQLERLAIMPFLLFSLAERDSACWQASSALDSNLDWLQDRRHDELRTTAVSFLWQLAGRNPYAARLVSGAGLDWCERFASCTLVDVLHLAASNPEMLSPRFPQQPAVWHKLLGPGLDDDEGVRRSAHITCLQWLLTGESAGSYRQLRAAACRNSLPTRRAPPTNRIR